YSNVDYDCLRKYDNNNKHFSITIIIENREAEQKHVTGYKCVYGYDNYRVKLEYDIRTGRWKIIPQQLSDILFHDIQTLGFNEQIETIIKRLNQQFFVLIYFEIFSPFFNQTIQPSTTQQNEVNPLVNIVQENSEQLYPNVDYDLYSSVCGSRSDVNSLAPPSTAPRRSRQNSACSTQSSVRYLLKIYRSFPLPSAPVRQRRVIESILLHVQRKKKTFEKIVDVIKERETITMYDLGLEFLHVHNDVDCQVDDIGPRSVLILNYKDQYTSVHV
ncbi:unnamed protein product, partial [Adineta steineri]